MTVQEWKNNIIEKCKRQILFRNNMSSSEIGELKLVLSDYLDEAVDILKKWRKLLSDAEFVEGVHDSAIVLFIKQKYQANGRDLFNDYSSGGVKANMKVTPENLLKGSCKQVM